MGLVVVCLGWVGDQLVMDWGGELVLRGRGAVREGGKNKTRRKKEDGGKAVELRPNTPARATYYLAQHSLVPTGPSR